MRCVSLKVKLIQICCSLLSSLFFFFGVTGNGPRHNTSSDDGLGHVFSEARRSKRYMSKRTSGTFRDYLKSRSIELPPDTETSTNSDGKLTQSPVDPTVVKLKSTGSFVRKGSMRRSTRATIAAIETDKISGASTDSSIAKQTIAAYNDDGGDNETNEKCDTNMVKVDDDATPDNNNSFLKKYDCEATTPKTQFESTDDWYASASDMDDSDSAVSKPYGYNAVNPVLECVNQVREAHAHQLHLHSRTQLCFWFADSSATIHGRFDGYNDE